MNVLCIFVCLSLFLVLFFSNDCLQNLQWNFLNTIFENKLNEKAKFLVAVKRNISREEDFINIETKMRAKLLWSPALVLQFSGRGHARGK